MSRPRPPGKLSGSAKLVGWLNALLDYSKANEITSITETPVGPPRLSENGARGIMILIPSITGITGSAGGGASVVTATYLSSQSEWITCSRLGVTTYVAKPPKLRGSVTSANIGGVTVSYGTYGADFLTRIATAIGITEKQVIVPRFLVGDLIHAVGISGGTGLSTANSYIDLNVDARAWARKFDQT